MSGIGVLFASALIGIGGTANVLTGRLWDLLPTLLLTFFSVLGLGLLFFCAGLMYNRFGITGGGFYPSTRDVIDGLRGRRVFIGFKEISRAEFWPMVEAPAWVTVYVGRRSYGSRLRDMGPLTFQELVDQIKKHVASVCDG